MMNTINGVRLFRMMNTINGVRLFRMMNTINTNYFLHNIQRLVSVTETNVFRVPS